MAISIPRVTSCCGCASLQTGAKIFAFMSMVGCIMLVILSGWEISIIRTHAPKETEAVAMLAVDIGLQLIQAGTSVLLLQGVYQEKAKPILPWLVTTTVMAIVEAFFMSSLFNRLFFYSGSESYHWLEATSIFLVDDIYGLLVVYSYYKSLAP
uniref:DUF7027 domain-containing protein n=1 Tax=Graphocephala atropunctata TaxID=36148 RepID=A0A1B6LZR3_9HEMI